MNDNEAYSILDLKPNASNKDITSSYRKLAKTYHPDINKAPEAADKFKQVQKAYEFLMNRKASTDDFEQYMNSFAFSDLFKSYTTNNSKVTNSLVLNIDDISSLNIQRIINILLENGIKVKSYSTSSRRGF